MTDSSTPLPPAGWYRDPAGGAAPRWWNGTAWAAANTVPADATPLPTAPAPSAAAPATPAAAGSQPTTTGSAIPPVTPAVSSSAATQMPASSAARTSYEQPAAYTTATSNSADTATNNTHTWQIWAIVLLPLLTIPGLLMIDAAALLPEPGDNEISSQLRLFTDPGYLFTVAAGWIIFIASIFLSIFDRRTLMSRGVERPFHWAFIFLGGFVYAVGRSIVVRSRTGQGLAPLWASIGVQLLTIVAAVVFFTNIMVAAIRFV
ncbi:DUF2510 domain-containing protein [Rhodoglobus sp. NPDC076762]